MTPTQARALLVTMREMIDEALACDTSPPAVEWVQSVGSAAQAGVEWCKLTREALVLRIADRDANLLAERDREWAEAFDEPRPATPREAKALVFNAEREMEAERHNTDGAQQAYETVKSQLDALLSALGVSDAAAGVERAREMDARLDEVARGVSELSALTKGCYNDWSHGVRAAISRFEHAQKIPAPAAASSQPAREAEGKVEAKGVVVTMSTGVTRHYATIEDAHDDLVKNRAKPEASAPERVTLLWSPEWPEELSTFASHRDPDKSDERVRYEMKRDGLGTYDYVRADIAEGWKRELAAVTKENEKLSAVNDTHYSNLMSAGLKVAEHERAIAARDATIAHLREIERAAQAWKDVYDEPMGLLIPTTFHHERQWGALLALHKALTPPAPPQASGETKAATDGKEPGR